MPLTQLKLDDRLSKAELKQLKLQRNVWYVAAWPEEITRKPLGRAIADEPIAFFRTEAGEVAAVSNVCPHRFAPLSRGELIGDAIECKYHGLRFNRDGHCVLNPHNDRQSRSAVIKAYPVVERHGLVWIWPGDAKLADSTRIPEVPVLAEGSGYHSVHNYIYASYRYDILIDNLLDLSHADYLHRGSFSSGVAARTELSVTEHGDEVTVMRSLFEVAAPPMPYGNFDAEGGMTDQWFKIHWHPGQVVSFSSGIVRSGEDFAKSVIVYFSHIATPASHNRTHYFFCITRDSDIDNKELDAFIGNAQKSVIEREDGPMLEDIDRNMGGEELMSKKPLILPTDAGGMRVRRVMKRLLDKENEVPR